MLENLGSIPNPMAAMPGFEAMRKQQEAFMKTILGGVPGWSSSGPEKEEGGDSGATADELAQIKKQLAELQKKLAKL